MPEQPLPVNFKKNIDIFVSELNKIYLNDLISVIVYGSVVSGEHSSAHSNVNLLVVLKSTGLSVLEMSRKLVGQFSKHKLEPLFLSQEYVLNFSHFFPIEFLDMRDNHLCVYGADVLKEIKVDTKNLHFQCAQELRSKVILLKQQFLRVNPKDRQVMANLLFKNFTSVVHILRNALRLKGKEPAYSKEAVLKEISTEFLSESGLFLEIWESRKNSAKLKADELKALLNRLVIELDKIILKIDHS